MRITKSICDCSKASLGAKGHQLHTSRFNPPGNTEYTLALIKPDLCADPHAVQAAIDEIKKLDPQNSNIYLRKELSWTLAQAELFYLQHKGRFFYTRLTTYMTSGPFEALVLTGDDIISNWRKLIGTTQPVRAKATGQNSLRAKFGVTDTRNSFHGSDSKEAALKEIQFVFSELWK